MTETEQMIDALESAERFLRNQELSEIGKQVHGKILESLGKVNYPLAKDKGACIVRYNVRVD
jgi:hypothetical protein